MHACAQSDHALLLLEIGYAGDLLFLVASISHPLTETFE
jgi:hypothetical protein